MSQYKEELLKPEDAPDYMNDLSEQIRNNVTNVIITSSMVYMGKFMDDGKPPMDMLSVIYSSVITSVMADMIAKQAENDPFGKALTDMQFSEKQAAHYIKTIEDIIIQLKNGDFAQKEGQS